MIQFHPYSVPWDFVYMHDSIPVLSPHLFRAFLLVQILVPGETRANPPVPPS
jgi:hypothetical protein